MADVTYVGNDHSDSVKAKILDNNIKLKLILSRRSDSQLPKYFALFTFIESSLKMIKNAFYFILKALFLSKILKFYRDFLVM